MQHAYSVIRRPVFIFKNNGGYLKLPGKSLSFINTYPIVNRWWIIQTKQEIFTQETSWPHETMKTMLTVLKGQDRNENRWWIKNNPLYCLALAFRVSCILGDFENSLFIRYSRDKPILQSVCMMSSTCNASLYRFNCPCLGSNF